MVLSLLQKESNVPIPKATNKKAKTTTAAQDKTFLRCGVIQIATPSKAAFAESHTTFAFSMMRLAIALMLIEREGPQAGPTLKQLGPRQRKSPEGKTGPRTNEVEVLVRGFWLKKLPMFQNSEGLPIKNLPSLFLVLVRRSLLIWSCSISFLAAD